MPVWTGVAIAAVAAITTAYGSEQSAHAQSASAKYNSQVQQNDAIIAKQNADYAAKEGEINAAAAQQKTRAEVGGLTANEGASGIDINSDSSSDTRASAAEVGQQNAINIRADAARKAYGYQTGSQQSTEQSNLDNFESDNASKAGDVSAGSSILGGASKISGQYNDYLKNKSPTSDFDTGDMMLYESTGGE